MFTIELLLCGIWVAVDRTATFNAALSAVDAIVTKGYAAREELRIVG